MSLEINYDNLLNLITTVSTCSIKRFSLEIEGLKILMEAPDVAVERSSESHFVSPLITLESVAESAVQVDQEWQIKAPLVGTFYRSHEVGADPFVAEGDRVKKGQLLGIIEAMKLFNEIESDVDGVVKRILVDNGQVVGFNDPLFIISL